MKNAPKKVFSDLGTYYSIDALVVSCYAGKKLNALGSRIFILGVLISVLRCSRVHLLGAP
jgi:hypothetical protein